MVTDRPMRIGIIACLLMAFLHSCARQQEIDQFSLNTPSDSISLVAVGDIMLGGTAQEVLIKENYDYPFVHMKNLLSGADIVIGNLEGPLTSICNNSMELDKEYVFRSPAEKVAPALKKAGFNLLNLANNHILDYGITGMQDTIDSLHQHNIATVGVGKNLPHARSGTIMNTPQGKVGFLSYSLTFPESFWATNDKPGTAFGHQQQVRADVKRLKNQVDLVIVSFHWGREKTTELRPYQPVLGRAAIDAGAALVIGHHPHVLQAIEKYKEGLIIYSLGNFVFGSYSEDAKNSLVARVILHRGKFHSAQFIPINVLNTEVIFQPTVLTHDDAAEVIKHINQLSAPLKTRLDQVNYRGFLHEKQNNLQSLARNN